MPVIKVEDISHVRFAAPDLSEMRKFIEDFGLVAFEEGGKLYGKGTGGAPFLHATELGEAGFRALGLRAENVADLQKLAEHDGVPIEPLDTPGGGQVVRLTDPDGFLVEIVTGQAFCSPAAFPPALLNTGAGYPRKSATVRLKASASTVMRLGHCVLAVSDFRASEAWYKERFGLITSDEIEALPGFSVGAFLRCDRGDVHTDHHTLFLLQAPTGPGFNHAAFEVAGIDDLMLGHDHLKANNRKQAWGVGRHLLGSQVFDYWKDPFGHELEHWTDGDQFITADGSNKATVGDLLAVQWGQPFPGIGGANEGIAS